MVTSDSDRRADRESVDGAERVPFETKVAFLSRCDSYPERTGRVELVETHMSCVFLTDQHAYKLKKPVVLEYADYRALAARERFCAEEIALNRELAPGVYLRLVPLTLSPRRALELDGRGEPVDWLVKMRRLPLSDRLDTAILRGTVDRRRLDLALRRLSAFYVTRDPVRLRPQAYRARLRQAIERNRVALSTSVSALDPDAVSMTLARQTAFVEQPESPLAERAARVIEAHGDLRPEHVYLGEPPLLVDRLEFDRELRLLDPADELVFLALECARLGAPWIEAVAFRLYEQESGDRPPSAVIEFYRSLRSCMRARLAIGHLGEARSPDEHWRALAGRYVEVAELASRQLPGCL